MFDGRGGSVGADPWAELDNLEVRALARLARENLVETTMVQNRVLLIAAAWADAHPGDPDASRHGPGSLLVERSVRLGGVGTPEVAEGAAFELGVVREVGVRAASWLIADALDLRHRLPGLWAGIVAGGVDGWKGRRVAQATRHLTLEAAGQVDQRLAAKIGQLAWGRIQTLLDAAVLAADPVQAARDAEDAAVKQGVWSGATDHRGIKSVYARTEAGNAVWFMGVVNRIADLLKTDGDHRSIDERRAAAIGIIAQPAQALELLHRHSHTPTPTVAEEETEADVWDGFDWASSIPDPDNADDTDDTDTDDTDADGDGDPYPEGLDFEDLPARLSGDWAPSGFEPGQLFNVVPPLPAGTADEPELDADDDRVLDRDGGLEVRLPVGFDPAVARPKVVLHYHLSETGLRSTGDDALVRPEHTDPTTLKLLLDFLAGTGCQVRVQPVIDPATTASVDAYEIPDRLRQAVRYREVAEVAPWGSSRSRSMDLDHTRPWRTSGPPGQTAYSNLGPLTRTVHRVKTLGVARVRQPVPGVFVWRTRHGHITVTTNRGTLYLGDTGYAHALWDLADQNDSP